MTYYYYYPLNVQQCIYRRNGKNGRLFPNENLEITVQSLSG